MGIHIVENVRFHPLMEVVGNQSHFDRHIYIYRRAKPSHTLLILLHPSRKTISLLTTNSYANCLSVSGGVEQDICY